MGAWTSHLEKFLAHPIIFSIVTFAITVVVVIFTDRLYQIVALAIITVFWVLVGCIRAWWRSIQEYYASLPGKIRYHCVIKEIEILDQAGNSNLSLTYYGENLGDTHCEKIFHVLRWFDSADFPPDKVEGSVDGEKVDVIIKSWSRSKKDDTAPSKYESRCIVRFPNSVPPKSLLPVHSFKVPIKEYCKKGFKSEDSTTHAIDVLTDRLLIRVKVDPSLIITGCSFSVSDFHESIDTDELKRLRKSCPIRRHGKTCISWEIPKPKLTYRYTLKWSFDLAK